MKRLLLLSGFVALAACTQNAAAPSQVKLPVKDIQLTGPAGAPLTVHAEIASTPSQQEQGLMERTVLPENSGMLFTFSEPQQLNFWMKNTLIPLDVLFFDIAGNFVSFATMTPCIADPCTIYSSQGEALSALEVVPGFTINHGIGAGWKMMMP